MKTKALAMVVAALSMLAVGCGSDDFSGLPVLQVEHGVNAEVAEGESMRVEGDVVVERDGNVVRVRPAGGSSGEALIRFPKLREIRARGNAEVVVRPIEAAMVVVDAGGTSHISIEGTTSTLTLRARGNATVDASGLEAEFAIVNASGSSESEISVSGSLEGLITGDAHVLLHGSPSTGAVDVQGSGELELE